MAKINEPFKISAAVVRQLGEELVSDELTAILELVKNSYDADADWVKISISTEGSPLEEDIVFPHTKGYITIEDNGVGMNYNDIISRWLFISLSHKREMKEKGEVTNGGRTPLGDKGLGRLSTQRLGNVIELYSCTEAEDLSHHVAFDWRHFTDDSPLDTVDTNYGISQKGDKIKGTKLIISDLKNPNIWVGKSADSFRGQLSKLIFPYKDKRPFDIYLSINDQSYDLDSINEKLRKLAISSYNFKFDGNQLTLNGTIRLSKLQGNSQDKKELYSQLIQSDNGANFFNFLTNADDNKKYFLPSIKYSGADGVFIKFKKVFDFEKDIKKELVVDEITKQSVIANPGPFVGEIDEFNISGTEEIESAYDKLSEYKQLVKNQIGVRIFRDGFAVKPYGMANDDWLQLRKSQTSGGSFYLLRPDNVIGFVSISAKDNRVLVEKTDREGFIDTSYSKSFFNLVNTVVKSVNDVLENTRRSYDVFKIQYFASRGGIKTFKETKERLVETAKLSTEIENEANTVHSELKVTASKVSSLVHRIRAEPLFSTDEEKSALVLLEEVNKILTSSDQLFEKINSILQNAKQLENDANYLEPKIAELENQIIQFSELAGLGLTAEAFTHEVYNILDRISVHTDQILKQYKSSNSKDTSIYIYIEHVRTFIKSIRLQLNHLSPSLKFNRETKNQIKLSDFLKEVEEYYYIRWGETIKLNSKITADFIIEINKGKLTQIFDNIILNSEYWLKQKSKETPNFTPTIEIEIKSPFILISDNGYGVKPEMEQTLFQPFTTAKPAGEGRGLGLFIVQQLLDSVDSTILFLQSRNDLARRYIFQINLGTLII